jgi:hypothetical protein
VINVRKKIEKLSQFDYTHMSRLRRLLDSNIAKVVGGEGDGIMLVEVGDYAG